MNHRTLSWIIAALISCVASLVAAEPPHIHTSRPSPKPLPLPKGDDVFHFIIFGDRTGGPPEGMKVLAQAVEDSNLLDPDLVMTVGDLVNGYNQTDAWMVQMEEYRGVMDKLKMPWFPVAGNHDIYWRRSGKNPETKPPREHEESYEKHFGPLWYWFAHKKTGFLVIFSDEGNPDGRQRSFSDPEQQQISRTQMDWIASALKDMKHLQHVFVFLHHPFWKPQAYPGRNWDDVHRLLVQAGNVRAVMAGHIHRMSYDGKRDGIGYYTLGATGASMTPGLEFRHFGLLHHFNVVTVRSNGYSMTAVPVGAVFNPEQFTPERLADAEGSRYIRHEFTSPPIPLELDGSVNTIQQLVVTNPTTLTIDLTLLGKADKSWVIAPDHRHAKVGPGQQKTFEFALLRDATGTLDGYEAPEFELRFDVLTSDARMPMPARSLGPSTALVRPEGGWSAVEQNGCFVFNGSNACLEIGKEHLASPDSSFTVEAWARPADEKSGGIVSNVKIGGFSLDVSGTPRFAVQTDDRSVSERTAPSLKPLIAAKAADKLPIGQWSHLAGVYDGSTITLFVNGKKAASAPAPGARIESVKSLYIGAWPQGSWNEFNISYPAGFWNGAVDDVRISRTARYTADFTPEPKLTSDAATVLALANDQNLGAFVPMSVPPQFQATVKGGAKVAPAGRR